MKRLHKRELTLTPKLNHAAYSGDYYRRLAAFVEEMSKSFEYWAKASLRKSGVVTFDAPNGADILKATLKELIDRWGKKADEEAPKLTQGQLNRLLRYVNGRYRPLMGKDADKLNKRMRELMNARYNENISLIKSIPRDILKRYEATLYDAVTGGDAAEIMKRLSVIKGITLRQAKRIAVDQTAKAVEAFNMGRQQELGLEYYFWDTAGDEAVSTGYGGHKQLNGLIFRYDTPEAVIDTYGNRGHPAQRVRCRCTSRGVYLKPGQRVKKVRLGYEIIGV